MYQYPFEIITGKGLGTSYSSLKQTGPLLPSRTFGQLDMKLSYNVTNGNVMIEDHPVTSMENNVPQEIKFIYNSNADSEQNAWRLAIKKLKQFPSAVNGYTGILIEEDGHETTLSRKWDGSNFYFAPEFTSGTPYITFDDKDPNQWFLYNPATQVKEYFNAKGNLIKKISSEGNVTNYEYDQNNILIAVTGPSNDRYDINHNSNTYQIINKNKIVQTSQFDKSGMTTTLANGYSIKYQYWGAGDNYDFRRIDSIKQSDGTIMSLTYNTSDKQNYLSRIRVGESTTFDFTRQANVTTMNGLANTQFYVDDNSRIAKVSCDGGDSFRTMAPDEKLFSYTPAGQLKTITDPDGGIDEFTYGTTDGSHEKILGLLKSHICADGRVINYYYEPGQQFNGTLVAIGTKENNAASTIESVTRYVYDYDFNNGNQFLRFKISPMGRVTEYRPTREGYIASKRVYTATRDTDIEILPPTATVFLANMRDWIKGLSDQDRQNITLDAYIYDYHGLVATTRHFANIDANGEGIIDAEASYDYCIWDSQGGWTEKKFKQIPNNPPQNDPLSTQAYDALHRTTSTTNALNESILTAYNDKESTITKTLPNGRLHVTKSDTQGLAASETDTVNEQIRNTLFARDAIGNLIRTQHPDLTYTYAAFDNQNRMIFSVSSAGSIIQYVHDVKNRFEQVIQYENAINVSALLFENKLSLSRVLRELDNPKFSDPAFCRSSYKFFDVVGRTQYEVDSKKYVTEYFYDKFNKVTQKIVYAKPLTDDLLNTLKTGESITLPLDVTQDRVWQYYRDNDNRLIGEKDPAGYVTEHVLDDAGRELQTILYATPKPGVDATNDFTKAKPAASPDDAQTTYFYNARNLVTMKMDAEGYVTRYDYLPCGLIDIQVCYANKLTNKTNFITQPASPAVSPEDRFTQFAYDKLNRETSVKDRYGDVTAKNGKNTDTTYDNMGEITAHVIYDNADVNSVDADKCRNQETQYDGWGQVLAETNPFIAQQLTIIEKGNLPPDEKKAMIALIWATSAIKHYYDLSGLRLKTLNTLNKPTYYYYDSDRRLRLVIGPTGIVKEKNYNATNDVEITRTYNTRVDISALTGGFIDDKITALLRSITDEKKDQTETFTFDQRSQVETKIDAENKVSSFKYSAFKECTQEVLPLSQGKNITVTHQQDVRGKETQTVYANADGKLKKIILREFNNLYGKLTKIKNAAGEVTLNAFDKVANLKTLTKKAQNIGETDYVHAFEHNAFKQLTVETNSLGNQVKHQYNPGAQQHTIINPEPNSSTTITSSLGNQLKHQYNPDAQQHTIINPKPNSSTIITSNIFTETMAITDALNNTQSWTHAPDGQVENVTDALNNTTQNQYNTEGLLTTTINPAASKTVRAYNEANQPLSINKDAGKNDILTQFQPNAFGTNDRIIDPRNVTTDNTFNRVNKLMQSIEDAGTKEMPGLGIMTQHQYNDQSVESESILGDMSEPNQWNQTTQVDDLNRPVGTTIDPKGLNIQASKVLDMLDRTIADTDANKNITYIFYDSLGNKRFTVDPVGTITEWVYNAEKQITQEKTYLNQIDPSVIDTTTTINQLQKLKSSNVMDSECHRFYDKNGRERFTLDIKTVPEDKAELAVVRETQYDGANREVLSIQYNDLINAATIDSFTTDSLITLMTQYEDAAKNRKRYCIFDAKGQERFIIEPNNSITEQQFDQLGNVITKIVYATPVTDAASLAKLPPDQVAQQIQKDSMNDRATYQVFDSANRLHFTVDGEGSVTRYDRNQNGYIEKEIAFNTRITISTDYNELVALVNALSIGFKDRVKTTVYDNANRVQTTTNALGYVDSYTYDALNNEKTHTDKRQQIWKNEFDRANRTVLKTSPARLVTNVIQAGNQLIVDPASSKTMSISKRLEHDPVSNIKQVIDAHETPFQRDIEATFHKTGLLKQTLVKNVAIDDPNKPASFDVRPEINVNITTQSVYDARKLPIAEQQENGFWSFNVRNSLGQICYRFEPLQAGDKPGECEYRVISYTNNAFGEVLTETKLNTTLKFSPTDFIETGIPYTWAIANIKKDNKADRNTFYERDQAGKPTTITKDDVTYFYIQNVDNNIKETVDTGTPTEIRTYNAFGETVCNSKLQQIDKTTKTNTFANTLYWFDRNGKVIAEYDPSGAARLHEYNAFGQREKTTAFARQLSFTPDTNTTFSTLKTALEAIKDRKDRTRTMVYDLVGQLIEESQVNVLSYSAGKDANGLPVLIEDAELIPIITRSHTYGPTGLRTSTTYADRKTTVHWFYDEAGNLVAEAGPVRQCYDDNMKPGVQAPLTYYGVDAHGQRVMTTRYLTGTNPQINPNVLPTPLSISDQDQCELTLMSNKRSTPICKQDARGNLTGVTTGPNKKTLRNWNLVSSWMESKYDIHLMPADPRPEDYEAHELCLHFDETGTLHYTIKDKHINGKIYKDTITAGTDVNQLKADDIQFLKDQLERNPIFTEKLLYIDNKKLNETGKKLKQILHAFFSVTSRRGHARTYEQAPVDYIDEQRTTLDAQNRTVATSVIRDGGAPEEVKRTQYNAFDETILEDIGSGEFVVVHKYNRNGYEWFNNSNKGISTLKVANLANQETAKMTSTAQIGDPNPTDLSAVTEAQIPDLFSTDKSPVAQDTLNIFMTQRDLAGRMTLSVSPSLVQNSNVTNIPIQVEVLTTADKKTLLTWPLPQENNIVTKQIVLNPVNNKNQKYTLDVTIVESYYQADVSALPTDEYEYNLSYYLNNSSNQLLNTSDGILQCQTQNSEIGNNVVVEIRNQTFLDLYGNNANLQSVNLMDENDKLVKNLPVVYQTGQVPYVDLSAQPSGRYTVVPVMKGGLELPESVPFSVFTEQAPVNIISREMLYSAGLSFLEPSNEMLLSLTLPDYLNFPTQTFRVIFDYTDSVGEIHHFDHTVEFQDGIYKIPLPSKTDIQEIDNFSLSMKLNDVDWLPLYINEPPLPETGLPKRKKPVFIHAAYREYDLCQNDEKYDDEDDSLVVLPTQKKLSDLTVKFAQHRQLMIYPLTGLTDDQNTISFLDISLDRMANWKTLAILAKLSQGVVVDVSGLPLGNYPFKNPLKDDTAPPLLFSVTDGKEVYSSDPNTAESILTMPVTHQFKFDNFGNNTTQINSKTQSTDKVFNHRDQVVQQQLPEVSVMLPNNTTVRARPTTISNYDINGFHTQEMDPNGNLATHDINEVGQRLIERLGDGTAVRQSAIDLLNRETAYADSRGKIAKKRYDQNNNVVLSSPLGWDESSTLGCLLYGHNQNNMVNSRTNGVGATDLNNFDARRNVIERISAAGFITDITYDHNREMLTMATPEGTLSWGRTVFGIPQTHTDLSKIDYRYDNDYSNNVRSQTSTGGHGWRLILHVGKGWIRDDSQKKRPYYWTDIYRTERQPAQAQNLQYIIKNGRLSEIRDNTQQIVTAYEYDTENLRVSVTTRNFDGSLIRQQTSTVDEAGREILAFDTRLTMSITLDAAGNQRALVIDIFDADLPQPLHSTINNQFDAAQRMVMQNTNEDGAASSLQHVYSQNFLVQEIVNGALNILTYYDNGLLWQTQRGDKSIITDRSHDADLRETSYKDQSKGTWATTAYAPNTSFINNVVQYQNDKVVANNTFSGNDSSDNPHAQHIAYDPNTYDDLTLGYQGGDQPVPDNIDGTRHTRDGSGPRGHAYKGFDSNFSPNGAVFGQTAADHTIQNQTAVIQSLPDGRMLSKTTIASQPAGNFMCYATKDEPFYSVNGNIIGTNTTHIAPQGLGFTSEGRKKFTTGAQGGVSYNLPPTLVAKLLNEKLGNLVKTYQSAQKFFDRQVTAAKSSFKLSVVAQTISESYPPPSPYYYLAKAGDTYDSIAEAKGMSGMGMQISNANGGAQLAPGFTVIIPPVLIDNNKPGNFAAYNQFIQDMVPSITPVLLAALPHQHHPSFFAQLVKIIAAVAILVIAPHLAPFLVQAIAAIGIPMMESVATGVVAGMMDAGVQGIEIATHMQKDFSFSEMITTSMTAGFATNSAEVTDVLKAAAEANVASQLGSMAIGASDKFDFRQLIDTVASAGISAKINLKLKDFFSKTTLTSFPGQLGQNTVNAVAGAGVNEIVYHQPPNVESLAAQSLGTTIATEAGNVAGEQIDKLRIQLGIPNEAETMAAKKAAEEKAVWRQDNSEQRQESQEQQKSTASIMRMMQAKQQIAAVSLNIGGLNTGDSNTISNDLYADWRSNAEAEAKPVSNANSNKQPFLSNPTSTGDSNGKWSSFWNGINRAANSSIVNGINHVGDIVGHAMINTLNNTGERFENLAWYGRFDTNSGESAYLGRLNNAYQTGNKQFLTMLQTDSPVSGTINIVEGLTSGIANGLGFLSRSEVIYGREPSTTANTLYHTVKSSESGQNLLNGVDPSFFTNITESRFGGALYLSEIPDTTLAELSYRNSVGVNTIRYDFDKSSANILDLTKPSVAERWGYVGGDDYATPQFIASRAQNFGFNAIRFPSERGLGANLAILDNFDTLLKPQMIVQSPQLDSTIIRENIWSTATAGMR